MKNKSRPIPVLLLVFILLPGGPEVAEAQHPPVPAIPFSPHTYVVYKTENPIPVDGNLDKDIWKKADWTEFFTDIRGDAHPAPRYRTQAKMLWDETYFYIAARLEDPHVWATLTERDAVIFMDNNFEVFIDPNGDTHHYFEIEVNALGTFWDLMLTKPYRNGGRAIDAWDVKGLKIGIDIQGTLNDPSDTDTGWTVELAIPWDVLEETTRDRRPVDGSQWRVNFSRVQWQTDITGDSYVKKKDPETGENLPEDNWVWSPQGLINMHYPEMWGIVQFSDLPAGTASVSFRWDTDEDYKWLLRELYYKQVLFRSEHGRYASTGEELGYGQIFSRLFNADTPKPELTINVLDDHYIIRLDVKSRDGYFYIRNDSRVWKTPAAAHSSNQN